MERLILRFVAVAGLLVAGYFWLPVKESPPKVLRNLHQLESDYPDNKKLADALTVFWTDYNGVRAERNQAKWTAIVALAALSVANLLIASRLPKVGQARPKQNK